MSGPSFFTDEHPLTTREKERWRMDGLSSLSSALGRRRLCRIVALSVTTNPSAASARDGDSGIRGPLLV